MKLWCTDCCTSFRTDSQDWENITCSHCGLVGDVVGRIIDGNEEYFTDQSETTMIPVVEE
jgi:hypothetical protein